MFLLWLMFGFAAPLSLEDALDSGLDFVLDNIQDINLDTVLGTRLVQDHLSGMLLHLGDGDARWRELRDKARRISDEGKRRVEKNDPEYAAAVGELMASGVRLLWYASSTVTASASARPSCSTAAFNETNSDSCLRQIVGPPVTCSLSKECVRKMSAQGQRDYTLTHQVLYWQLAYTRGCFEVSAAVRLSLCSDVMRDARRIAAAGFPRNQRDLFMEQVGLCGLWGFVSPSSWIGTIVSWQNKRSGCFDDRAKFRCQDNLVPDRLKRREKKLKGGCLAHKTAVGLLAIAVGIRFQAEQRN